MNFTGEETCKFIRLVRAQKCLWMTPVGSRCARYIDKWTQIGAQFGISGVDAYIKFKALGNSYFLEKKKDRRRQRNGLPVTSTWELKPHLRFLDLAPRDRRSARPAPINADETDETRPAPQFNIPLGDVHEEPVSSDLSDTSSIASECLEDMASDIRIPSPTQAYERLLSMEVAFADNAHRLLNAVSSVMSARQPEKPYDAVVEFIRSTLVMLPVEERSQLERDLMETCIKYRYART